MKLYVRLEARFSCIYVKAFKHVEGARLGYDFIDYGRFITAKKLRKKGLSAHCSVVLKGGFLSVRF